MHIDVIRLSIPRYDMRRIGCFSGLVVKMLEKIRRRTKVAPLPAASGPRGGGNMDRARTLSLNTITQPTGPDGGLRNNTPMLAPLSIKTPWLAPSRTDISLANALNSVPSCIARVNMLVKDLNSKSFAMLNSTLKIAYMVGWLQRQNNKGDYTLGDVAINQLELKGWDASVVKAFYNDINTGREMVSNLMLGKRQLDDNDTTFVIPEDSFAVVPMLNAAYRFGMHKAAAALGDDKRELRLVVHAYSASEDATITGVATKMYKARAMLVALAQNAGVKVYTTVRDST